MKKNKTRRGFTLVELLIVAVISVIVIMTTTLVLFITFRAWRSANVSAQFRREIALTMQYLSKDVRESNNRIADIVTTASGISFAPNEVRPDTHDYTADFGAGTLVRTDDDGALTLISGGLQDFNPVEIIGNDGVSLRIELFNEEFNIGVTNETFISVRNRK